MVTGSEIRRVYIRVCMFLLLHIGHQYNVLRSTEHSPRLVIITEPIRSTDTMITCSLRNYNPSFSLPHFQFLIYTDDIGKRFKS